MKELIDGGPAFPSNTDFLVSDGMSLRDWFAGQALASWCEPIGLTRELSEIANAAYALADAMLVTRNEKHTASSNEEHTASSNG